MRTVEPLVQNARTRQLSENLAVRLAKGREWATPGVEAALQRAVLGLDAGVESASPRIQAVVRRLADELAGGVESVTPRIHEGLHRVAPKAAPVVLPAEPARSGSHRAWMIAAVAAILVSVGAAAWRYARTPDAKPRTPEEETAERGWNPEDSPANSAARI
ncbi:hypothetical protein [Arthrobacter sp. KK5.5]|uniref:hypothetical protein n=1 Tax=Arthrobacter sp. KK5.5 TaxID=3373084 RepID=UPI003EE4A655